MIQSARYVGEYWFDEEETRSVGNYRNDQKILLVGEGDFSFASSLATSFCYASNIIATSLDSRGTVIQNYSSAEKNLHNLVNRGAVVLHKIDVGSMNKHPQLRTKLFDRIVFNFPHAGGYFCKESDPGYIECHRQVVREFFKAATYMLAGIGEIHVTHKTTPPFDKWNIDELAHNAGLELTRVVKFDSSDYRGYNNKKGYGPSWNATFPVADSSTFIFCLSW